MTRTAKETFLTGPYRSEFEKIAQSAAFLNALDYAELAWQDRLPPMPDSSHSWSNGIQVIAVKAFVKELKTLHEPVIQPQVAKSPELHYGTK